MDHADPPPAPDTAAVAPAVARPRWYVELRWQAVTLALTTAFLVTGQRLDRADFTTPFTYELDALLILPYVKSTVETGTHWHNDRLGAPGVQELHDFPVVDHLHLAVIWLLGRAWPDPVVVFNLFHLLTYPLVAATALFVLRHFGLSPPAAIAGALLYAFQPYHYLRGQLHYFLAAYYVVPLTLMVTLWVCRGRLPFFREQSDGTYRRAVWSRDALVAVVVAALTASAGAYYAFFGCSLLAVAGAYGWVVTRTWRAAASAGVVVALIVVGGVLNHAPTFAYQYEYGASTRARARPAEDAERYGLRIVQLVFPVAGHNPVGIGDQIWFDPAALRSMYQAPQFKELNESDWDSLGLVASAGYVLLLVLPVLPVSRRWPLGPLSALTLSATLFATTGGLGAVFNYLVSPQVRCHNRISIYLAFLALFASCWLLDRLFDARSRWLRWPAFALVTLFGIWDQTDDKWFPDIRTERSGYQSVEEVRKKAGEDYRNDRWYFERVESVMPEGMVFQYPHMEYPEAQPYQAPFAGQAVESYEPMIGYLHTQQLRWSFGAMKGREYDTWAREVCGQIGAPPAFVNRLVYAGFDGLLIDARGIGPKRFADLKEGIEQHIGHGALRVADHPTKRLYFYDLRGHRELHRRNIGSAQFEAMCRAELERVYVLWLRGFASFEPLGYEDRRHWCPKDGLWVIVNRCEHPVTATVQMRLKTTFKGTARVSISGEVWSDEVEIDQNDTAYAREVVIPPGRHWVRVRCSPAISVLPVDSRNDLFAVLDFRLRPVR